MTDKVLMFQAQDERELYEWLSILAKPRENRPSAKRRYEKALCLNLSLLLSLSLSLFPFQSSFLPLYSLSLLFLFLCLRSSGNSFLTFLSRSVSFDHSSGTSDTIDRENVAHPPGGSNIVITSSSSGQPMAAPAPALVAARDPNRASPRTGMEREGER
jgi:hypothetical protein